MTDTPDDDIDPLPAGYQAAVDELDDILLEIEGDTVDVDILATRVARASALLRWCRTRLVAAKDAVDAAATELTDG